MQVQHPQLPLRWLHCRLSPSASPFQMSTLQTPQEHRLLRWGPVALIEPANVVFSPLYMALLTALCTLQRAAQRDAERKLPEPPS